MRLKAEFLLGIQVLTPVHIGTGNVLQQDFDFVVRGGQTLRIHEERFVEWVAARGEAFARLSQGVPPGKLLESILSSQPELVRYALPGAPKGTQEIRECIKDATDHPYLPASSLKGALRTVLLWHFWNKEKLSLAGLRVERAKFAAQPLERRVFGEKPQEDLLKALRLADSSPAPKEALGLANVRCVSKATKDGIPLALEVIKPKTVLHVEGHIDETAFRPWGSWAIRRDNKNPFLPEEKRAALRWDVLAQAAREKAKRRLEYDLRWVEEVKIDPKPWKDLMLLIQRAERGELQGFPLQVGFGTGWLGTTLGPALFAVPDFRQIYKDAGLGKTPRTSRQTPLERFPASRRLVCYDTTCQPLGWIWVIPKETT